MKIVYLDQFEHDSFSTEEVTTYALAAKQEYRTHDDFIFATVSSGFFPKDERWYAKSDVEKRDTIEQLFNHRICCPDLRGISESDVKRMLLLNRDWDDVDFTFETDTHYCRIYWYTTA
jgi:hypothetical protein